MDEKKIIIADFGSKYGQSLARKIRKLKSFCEVVPPKNLLQSIDEFTKGIILIGERTQKLIENEKTFEKEVFEKKLPVLAIGYGMELMLKKLGVEVNSTEKKTEEDIKLVKENSSKLLENFDENKKIYYKNALEIKYLPEGFETILSSENNEIMAIQAAEKDLYAINFHPEFEDDSPILENFLYEICEMPGNWTMENFAKDMVSKIKETVKDKRVLLALSGGVDSSVCAKLISQAVGKNLNSIFVDTGLMRKNEADEVYNAFKYTDINFITVDASERFLEKLADVKDPEMKRKIIGEEFIRVFEEEAKKIGAVDYLAQGTIYPDIIESGEDGQGLVKSHHNVGGLPDVVDFKELIEPLKTLFKDEVRQLGKVLGLDEELVERQPFPGPGLAVRVMGDITKSKLDILREADYIYRKEIKDAGYDKTISQYFCVLTDIRAVGVKKDVRTYERVLALRAIETVDFMSAKIVRLPYAFLEKVATKIINEVDGIGRVVYDITQKPPGTIEWE